jgi:hypothetical protein
MSYKPINIIFSQSGGFAAMLQNRKNVVVNPFEIEDGQNILFKKFIAVAIIILISDIGKLIKLRSSNQIDKVVMVGNILFTNNNKN